MQIGDIMQINDIAKITAPALLAYTKWVLKRAEQKNIKTLYFIARDGYIPYKLAQILCKQEKKSIECRYLFCSRYSLRIPAFHLMGEERNKLLFCGGNRLTAEILLSRGGLDRKKRFDVYQDIDETVLDEDKLLTRKQAAELGNKLKRSRLFQHNVDNTSKKAYKNTVGYLKQEFSDKNEAVGIVDLGWTGTTARSISLLLSSCGISPKITGFYFGLYRRPPDTDRITSEEFFFNPSSSPIKTAMFCNNLLEAVSVAPHGRTISYDFDGEKYFPVLGEDIPNNFAEKLLEAELNEENYSYEATAKSLIRLMNNPSKQESELLSRLDFCDDVCDGYKRSITAGELKDCTAFAKLKSRITDKPIETPFWEYGVIGQKNPRFKSLYRANIFLWEMLRICRYRLSWECITLKMRGFFASR